MKRFLLLFFTSVLSHTAMADPDCIRAKWAPGRVPIKNISSSKDAVLYSMSVTYMVICFQDLKQSDITAVIEKDLHEMILGPGDTANIDIMTEYFKLRKQYEEKKCSIGFPITHDITGICRTAKD